MKDKFLTLLVVALLAVATPVSAQLFTSKKEPPLPEYKVDGHRNVVVSKVLENLEADVPSLYAIAHEYIKEAYQETKYEFLLEQPEAGVVAGRGRYENYYIGNGLVYSYNVCSDFTLRVDIKKGRMRISILADVYSGTERNMNVTHQLEDSIATTRPIVEDNPKLGEEREHIYSKAFKKLLYRMQATCEDVATFVKERAVLTADDDW